MRTVGIRELKQNASAVVAVVESGEALTITSHGRPVARMLPIIGSRLEELESEGRLRRANASLIDLPPRVRLPPESPDAGDLLRQMRDEERY